MYKNILKQFPFNTHCKLNIYTTHHRLELETQYNECLVGGFLCVGLLVTTD